MGVEEPDQGIVDRELREGRHLSSWLHGGRRRDGGGGRAMVFVPALDQLGTGTTEVLSVISRGSRAEVGRITKQILHNHNQTAE